ncbi:MAG: PAS domain S-box protein [Flavobacteriia bacterium]|nr:PAS domain S-box protein [Flavobacteriia bacterium]
MFNQDKLNIEDLMTLSKDELVNSIQLYFKEQKNIREQLKDKESKLELCKENEIRYKSIFELSSDAILIIEKGRFVECNQAVLNMLGYKTKDEFLNTHPSALSPEKQPDGRYSFEKAEEMMNLALEKGIHKFEWVHIRSNGENFPVEVWLSAVEYGGRTVINTIWRDLTEIKKKEEIILKNIKEKEILVKEIHHRVKNNFQIVSSLLNLQSEYIDDDKFQTLCMQCKNRIDSMCKIHEMMYGVENLSSISFTTYLNNLLENIILSSNKTLIEYSITGDEVMLSIEFAIPVGLIINEIITNAVKYAFETNSSENRLYIKIKDTPPQKIIEIGDNGKGYDPELFVEDSSTLGFQLIHSLIQQIDGTITKIEDEKGTHYRIVFSTMK